MSNITFDSILSGVYTETCDEVKRGLRLHRESCMKLGYLCYRGEPWVFTVARAYGINKAK